MKVFVIFAAVALLACVADANKKRRRRRQSVSTKQNIHKIACGTVETSYPVTQKGDFVSFEEAVDELSIKPLSGYGLIQRNAKLGATYAEINLFSEFSDDQVQVVFGVTRTCAQIRAMALQTDGTYNFDATTILDTSNVLYQQHEDSMPFSNPPATPPATENLIIVTPPQTEAPRTASNFGEDGCAPTKYLYIARDELKGFVAVSLAGGNATIVGCADIVTVECAAPKTPKEKKTEETTKKQAS